MPSATKYRRLLNAITDLLREAESTLEQVQFVELLEAVQSQCATKIEAEEEKDDDDTTDTDE